MKAFANSIQGLSFEDGRKLKYVPRRQSKHLSKPWRQIGSSIIKARLYMDCNTEIILVWQFPQIAPPIRLLKSSDGTFLRGAECWVECWPLRCAAGRPATHVVLETADMNVNTKNSIFV